MLINMEGVKYMFLRPLGDQIIIFYIRPHAMVHLIEESKEKK